MIRIFDPILILSSSSSSKQNKGIRRDIQQAAKLVRREVVNIQKDLLTGGRAWKKSTEKLVDDVAPKMSVALDETMNRTNELFSKAMNIVEKQTRETQVDLLHAYKNFLSSQIDIVDRRLKRIKK